MASKPSGQDGHRNWGWSARLVKALNNDGVGILFALTESPKRYSQLLEATGLEHPTLDRKLQDLRNLRVITRRRLPEETRDWNEYYLTKTGVELARWLTSFEEGRQREAVEAVSSKGKLDNFSNGRGHG